MSLEKMVDRVIIMIPRLINCSGFVLLKLFLPPSQSHLSPAVPGPFGRRTRGPKEVRSLRLIKYILIGWDWRDRQSLRTGENAERRERAKSKEPRNKFQQQPTGRGSTSSLA
jgi:hypothetical protein